MWQKNSPETSHSSLIYATHHPEGTDPNQFLPFIFFIEQQLYSILPKNILERLQSKEKKFKIQELSKLLPIIHWNLPSKAPSTLAVNFLSPAEFTSGMGRYSCDTLSRWLVPGKFLNITSTQSLNFTFHGFKSTHFFFQRILLDISDFHELQLIGANIDLLMEQIRLNILAVKHARQVVCMKKLSSEQKKIIIEENIASILQRPTKTAESCSLFDQMHNFFVHLCAEEKITQIKEQFVPFMEHKPKIFDRDIFHEIKHFILLFERPFTAARNLEHVAKIISYQFLFRKSLQHAIAHSPQKRHLSIKLFKTHLSLALNDSTSQVLGILGAINILSENELFEERHVTEALEKCLPGSKKVDGSLVIDRRSHDPIRTFYIEIKKGGDSPWTIDEMKELRKKFPTELKKGIESILHPVFMPRNEEEVMRNILILSQQLRYIGDIPQMILSFDRQTAHEIFFTVILVRLVKGFEPSIKEAFSQKPFGLHLDSCEIKSVGHLRKKYQKEANIFSVKMAKNPFLREDFTLDLIQARQSLFSNLSSLFGVIRDFNGGILSKQQEIFQELQKSVTQSTPCQDFILENFFYSFSPPLRQTLLPLYVLKKLFHMQQEALKASYAQEPSLLKAYTDEEFLLLLAAAPNPLIEQTLRAAVADLQIPTTQLSFTHIHAHGITCLGYIYQNRDYLQRTLFYEHLFEALKTHLKQNE